MCYYCCEATMSPSRYQQGHLVLFSLPTHRLLTRFIVVGMYPLPWSRSQTQSVGSWLSPKESWHYCTNGHIYLAWHVSIVAFRVHSWVTQLVTFLPSCLHIGLWHYKCYSAWKKPQLHLSVSCI